MKYNLYRQGPEERRISSNVPLLSEPWALIGSVDRNAPPEDVSWASVVYELTGKNIKRESARGIWYKVIAEEVSNERG